MQDSHFAICIRNTSYEASLELRKLYERIPDSEAEKHHFLRIIDESGEDYLFPESCFFLVSLPATIEEALLQPSH